MQRGKQKILQRLAPLIGGTEPARVVRPELVDSAPALTSSSCACSGTFGPCPELATVLSWESADAEPVKRGAS